VTEFGVRKGIKKLIEDNSSSLLSGIIQQGEERYFSHVTTSAFTAPTGYYYIAITTTGSRYTSDSASRSTVRNPSSQHTHDVLIEIADSVVAQNIDDEIFEQADGDFRLLVERIVELIRSQVNFIEYEETDSNATDYGQTTKFRLSRANGEADRRVLVRNLSGTWQDAEQYEALGYCQISFSVEEC